MSRSVWIEQLFADRVAMAFIKSCQIGRFLINICYRDLFSGSTVRTTAIATANLSKRRL